MAESRINTKRVGYQITKALRVAGLEVRESYSRLSDSVYLAVDRVDENDEDHWGTFRIRISNHEAKPTYQKMYPFDFDAGRHHDSDGDWLDAVVKACDHFDLDPPQIITRRRTRRNDLARASREAQKAQWDRERVERDARRAEENVIIEKTLSEVSPKLDDSDWELLRHIGFFAKPKSEDEIKARIAFSQSMQRKGIHIDKNIRRHLVVKALGGSVFGESFNPEDVQESIEERGGRLRFRLSYMGAVVVGWLTGARLNDKKISHAGEVQYAETPIGSQNQGISKNLIKHALRLMKEKGSTRVVMGAISEEGAGLIKSLCREGILGNLLKKEGGDCVYQIPGAIPEKLAGKILRMCHEARGDHSEEELGYWIGGDGISELAPGETHMDYLFEDPQIFHIDLGDHDQDDGEFLWTEAMRLGWVAARKTSIFSGEERWWIRCANIKRSRHIIEGFVDYVLEEGHGEGYENVSIFTPKDSIHSTLSKISSGYLGEIE